MNILLIGSGGRENALAYKIAESPLLHKLFIAPGNAGCKEYGTLVNMDINNFDDVLAFCKENEIHMVVIGPEIPLVEGLADFLMENDILVFGPSKKAAQIEGSKAFAKNLMKKYNIPTAKYKVCRDMDSAIKCIEEIKLPLVIKADGLAAGKGVIIPKTMDEAISTIKEIMEDKIFGTSGSQVVIEEFLEGEEVSILCFTDGKTIKAMLSSQDHKRIFDNDTGPNTGGMGAYAPAPMMNELLEKRIYEEILNPIIDAMAKENCPFKGCLYAGLMVKDNVPKVVEFNARFGDPETQVVLPLLKTDLLKIMLACINEDLHNISIKWEDGYAVCVVLASCGYPDKYETGFKISGLNNICHDDIMVFHAGTKEANGEIITNGGRVLNVVAKDKSLDNAIKKVYNHIEKIHFPKMFYRKDIGAKGLNRLKEKRTLSTED